jgi:hypothetical protein
MAMQAREAMDTETLSVVADRGYFSGNQILKCAEEGILTTVPKPNTSNSPKKQQYDKRYFKYIAEDDEYECPAGERLTWRMRVEEGGLEIDKYWTSNCVDCPLKKVVPMAKSAEWAGGLMRS